MRLLKQVNSKKVLFIDIETVRIYEKLDIDSPTFDAWSYKHNKKGDLSDKELQQLYTDRAALEPEFSRVACISMGMIVGDSLFIKSFADPDEAKLLRDFNDALERTQASVRNLKICGWANIGFDVPFIFKRCMANRITPSDLLETAGEKPWTLAEKMLDLKDLWKGTSFSPTSLICATVAMGLPHPKDDISGADVGRVYYEEKDGLSRIVKYCEKDVLATANLFRAFRFEEPLEVNQEEPVFEKQPLVIELANGASLGAKTKKKVEDMVGDLTSGDREVALEILESLAHSKSTKVTKTFVKSLKERYAAVAQS